MNKNDFDLEKWVKIIKKHYTIMKGFHPETYKITLDDIEAVSRFFYDLGLKKSNVENEQKPAEWSEDDKNIISDAEVWLDTLCDYLKDSSSAYIPNVRAIISKLKSLKDRVQPQSQWKPSDDQMHSLKQAIDSYTFEPDYLEELYEDLKELKGE